MIKTPFYGTDVGDRVQLQKVLLLGSSDFTIIGRPILPVHQVYIEAVVIEKTLEHPKVWYQFHRRRRHHKLRVLFSKRIGICTSFPFVLQSVTTLTNSSLRNVIHF
ncbi:unnamed protein product [Schistosoma margrebowiei]|uniref:Large ribosomal subunit protein bL21m n=1 Tax=Schistosoma margrebowiei TaxID=48269 RepID=A0AA85ANK7_9TREM|nr:unnamed protein product [Schistosoma margrebowiei]